jgi:GNAT superfamily N-acetyltransferase
VPGALTIGLADDSDVDRVMHLVRDCIAAMRAAGIDQWDDIYPSRATIEADVQDATLYAAHDPAGSLLGVIVLNERQSPEYANVPWSLTAGGVAVVHRLMVDPRHQGLGIARALMAFAEALLRSRGYQVIRLDAFSLNPRALRLYERLGYRDAGPVTLRKGVFRCFEKSL